MDNNRPVVDSTGKALEENRHYRVTISPNVDERVRDGYAATTGANGSIFTVVSIYTDRRGNQMAVCQRGTSHQITMTNETFVFTPVTGGRKRTRRKTKLIRK